MPERARQRLTARLRHAGIVVSDLKRAVRFYRAVFGFSVSNEACEAGPFISALVGLRGVRLCWTKLATADGSIVELLEYRSPRPPRPGCPRADRIGVSHAAFTVPNLERTCAALLRRGGRVVGTPQTSPDGKVRVVYAHDPDGAILELVQELR